jgi:hypothetical protein
MTPDAQRRRAHPASFSTSTTTTSEAADGDDTAGARVIALPIELVRCAICCDFHEHGEADRRSAVHACWRCAFGPEHQSLRLAFIATILDEVVAVRVSTEDAAEAACNVQYLIAGAVREVLIADLAPIVQLKRA